MFTGNCNWATNQGLQPIRGPRVLDLRQRQWHHIRFVLCQLGSFAILRADWVIGAPQGRVPDLVAFAHGVKGTISDIVETCGETLSMSSLAWGRGCFPCSSSWLSSKERTIFQTETAQAYSSCRHMISCIWCVIFAHFWGSFPNGREAINSTKLRTSMRSNSGMRMVFRALEWPWNALNMQTMEGWKGYGSRLLFHSWSRPLEPSLIQFNCFFLVVV
jgi:hypothetical protein